MNYEDALKYIGSTKSLGIMLGLDRVKKLLEGLDNPQDKLKIIHVAGTNGKGSVCAMTSEILKCAGYKVGTFSSPVIFDYREQFLVNGIMITEEQFAKIIDKIIPVVESMEDQPTEFEIIVAVAFLFFLEMECDIVVMEVGMGGSLDATNVFESPLMSVIVNIDYDHMGFLGDTLEEIATNKAGIIKEDCPVIVADQSKEVLEVIREIANKKNAPVTMTDNSSLVIKKKDVYSTIFDYKEFDNIELALVGKHQTKNGAVVLEIVKMLNNLGFSVSKEALLKGLAQVCWPGRFEIYSKDPVIILDGSHNPHGIRAMMDNLKLYFSDRKFVFIVGILGDKDYSSMIKETMPFAKTYIAIRPDNDRALSENDCATAIRYAGFEGEVYVSLDTEDAIKRSLEMMCEANDEKLGICVFGSLYNIANVKAAFDKAIV